MKRIWTIIGVTDMPQSFVWRQSPLGLPETAPAHDYFGQIVASDGTVDDFDVALLKARARQSAGILRHDQCAQFAPSLNLDPFAIEQN
jgi:hypothetical protein